MDAKKGKERGKQEGWTGTKKDEGKGITEDGRVREGERKGWKRKRHEGKRMECD